MIGKRLYRRVALSLIVAMLIQVSPWGYQTVALARMQADLMEEYFASAFESLIPKLDLESTDNHPELAPDVADCEAIYLPAIPHPGSSRPPQPRGLAGPDVEIIQPRAGWTISGMTWFAVQPFDPSQVDSVSFRAGTTDLGTDSTPEDGFRVFLDVSTLPDGQVELSATATNPCGETTKTVNVNVVTSPGQNTTVTANGGVVASEIGSLITIPPGGAPAGTTVTITEKTQEQITAENGFDWDAMGVTFLGAQVVTSSVPFSLPVTVASAGFGPRVQPGQVVVNYNIVPDADGDGVDELVVVNGASVAPNGDVISDPVPQVQVESAETTSNRRNTSPRAVQAGVSGPPGTIVEMRATGFNPVSAFGSVALFRSSIDGTVFEVPGFVSVDPNNTAAQIFKVPIPALAPGEATLTLLNKGTASASGPFVVSVEPAPSLSGEPSDIIDTFLSQSTSYIGGLPASRPDAATHRDQAAAKLIEVRSLFQQLAADPAPKVQQLLTDIATVVETSDVLTQLSAASTSPRELDPSTQRILEGIILVIAVIAATIAVLVAAKIIVLSVLLKTIIALVALIAVLIRGYIWLENNFEKLIVEQFPYRFMFCIRNPQLCPLVLRNGMGSVPPSGGPGGGNAPHPPDDALVRAAGAQNDFFNFTPGRVVVKVLSSGFPIPFTGVTDAGGYFYIPLIPEGEPFVATAIDTFTGQTRTFEGIGPPVGESVFMFFDFFSGDEELPSVRWDGGGDGSDWNDPLNWDTDTLPGATDRVLIDVPGSVTVTHAAGNTSIVNLTSREALVLSGGTLSLDAQSEISNTFTLINGTLTGLGKLTIKEPFRWSRGTIGLFGGVVAEGGLEMTGAVGNKAISSALVNSGSATWTDGTLTGSGVFSNTGTLTIDGDTTKTLTVEVHNGGTVQLRGSTGVRSGNSTVFGNLAGGVFDFQSDVPFEWFGGGFPIFNNEGTVRKSAGTGTSILNARFSGGNVEVESGTLSLQAGGNSTMSGGDFTVAGGAVLDLTGGVAHTLEGNFSGSGDGTVQLSSSTLNIGSEGAIFNFSGELFQWSDGNIGGSGTLTNTGTVVIDGDVNKNLTVDFNNVGSVLLRGTTGVQSGNGAVFSNLATGLFDFQSDASFIWFGGGFPIFNNDGIVRKSEGTGTSLMNATFSGGNVEVETGTLSLQTGNNSTTSGGDFTVAGGAVLDLTGGAPHTYVGNYTGTGGGLIRLNSSTLNIGSEGATFNFTGEMFQWTEGTLGGSGTLTNSGTLVVDGDVNKSLTVNVNNFGTVLFRGAAGIRTGNGRVFNNLTGGLFDFQSSAPFDHAFGALPTFNNAGTLRKSTSASTALLDALFSNSGTVDVQMGTLQLDRNGTSSGTIEIAGGQTVDINSTFENEAGGVIQGSGTLDVSGATFTNNGTIAPTVNVIN